MKKTNKNAKTKKIFSLNRKAYYDYEILEKFESGVILSGHEVKSVRHSNASLVDGIIRFSNGESFLDNVFIAPYKQMSNHIVDYNARRKRKLLLHKSEISKMCAKVKEKGFTVVPLKLYDYEGKIKLLIGLAKGKKMYDKKEAIKKKDIEREVSKEYRSSL
jgi:SsrA-binding protein